MICIEGPNAAGKSTLCYKFAFSWDMRVHYERKLDNPVELWRASWEAATERGEKVLDRCFISECIYRSPCVFTLEQLYTLALAFNIHCGLMLFLLPPWPVIRDRFQYDDNPYHPKKVMELQAIYERYEMLGRGELEIETRDGIKINAQNLLPENYYFRKNPIKNVKEFRDFYSDRLARRVEYHARWNGMGTLNPGGIVVMIEGRYPSSGIIRGLYHSGLQLQQFHITSHPEAVPYLEPALVVRGGRPAPATEKESKAWGQAVRHAYNNSL